MSQQSNGYILRFSAIMTLIVGFALAATNTGLKPLQQKAEELDRQKQILSSVMNLDEVEDPAAVYSERIESFAINRNGERLDGVDAAVVDVRKEYKNNAPEDRVYPVFTFLGEDGAIEAYILPIFGNGLWDNIWGFVALDTDLNTIKGVSLDHAGETPGLGARITTPEVQGRFEGTKVFNEAGELVAVTMLKGEGNPESALDEHHINGMSGATITGNGVSAMLVDYMGHYEAFLTAQGGAAAVVEEPAEVEVTDSTAVEDVVEEVIEDESATVENE